MDKKMIGKYAFLAGVVLALVGVWVDAIADIVWLMPLLGLVAGFLYIDGDDATGYYIFVMAVAAASTTIGEFFGAGSIVSDWFAGTLPMLGAGAVALILLEFYKRLTS